MAKRTEGAARLQAVESNSRDAREMTTEGFRDSEGRRTSLNDPHPARALDEEPFQWPPEVWQYTLKQFAIWAYENTAKRVAYTPIWHFTRALKAYFPIGTKSDTAFQEVDLAVSRWTTGPSEPGGWERYFGMQPETAHLEFTVAWRKIRYLPGSSPVEQALEKAKAFPFAAPRPVERTRPTPGYDRFVSLAVWLQVGVGSDNPIVLPVRKIAEALETDQRMIHLWTQTAIADGFLEKVAKHVYRPKGGSRAAKYRITERFMPWVMKVAADKSK